MNPAYSPNIHKYRAQARLANALREKGWMIYGYTEGDTEATDMVNVAQWHGYAEHPDLPGIVIVCGLDLKNEPIYRNPDWTAKFAPNGNGVFYHLEEDGHYRTMGNGTHWNGTLSDDARKSLAQHADFLHRRATALVTAKRRKAEKAAKKEAAELRRKQAAEKKEAKTQRKQDREAAKAAKTTGAGAGGTSSNDSAPAASDRKRPALPKGMKPGDDPADQIVLDLKPLSPLITDPTPVVIDALVANLMNRPTWLPPETDFAAITAAKIAEFYGFDAAKTTEAARQLAALLEDPAISAQEPKQRNMALRTQARSLLH